MPDLEHMITEYSTNKNHNLLASVDFMRQTLLRNEARPKGLYSIVSKTFGNSEHLWLWDTQATIHFLEEAGFSSIRKCAFNDSEDPAFEKVEDYDRFLNAVAIEAIK
jgi:hypothetical protein